MHMTRITGNRKPRQITNFLLNPSLPRTVKTLNTDPAENTGNGNTETSSVIKCKYFSLVFFFLSALKVIYLKPIILNQLHEVNLL